MSGRKNKDWYYSEEKFMYQKMFNHGREIVKMCHDSPVAGHPGQWKAVELIARNYWWPNMTKFVFKCIIGCNPCQQYKKLHNQPMEKLNPVKAPKVGPIDKNSHRHDNKQVYHNHKVMTPY